MATNSIDSEAMNSHSPSPVDARPVVLLLVVGDVRRNMGFEVDVERLLLGDQRHGRHAVTSSSDAPARPNTACGRPPAP